MRERRVGIRDLKARLSGYVRDVKNGGTVTITERGRPVGRLIPVGASPEGTMEHLARSGDVAWSGRKLPAGRPVARVRRGRRTVADIVVENRD